MAASFLHLADTAPDLSSALAAPVGLASSWWSDPPMLVLAVIVLGAAAVIAMPRPDEQQPI